jgi:adenine-specific DNA-methyltransferase
MSENFAETFFSRSDCRKIGFIREDIETMYSAGEVNERERAALITSLLYAADKIANTCGHYDAYRQGMEFNNSIELCVPILPDTLNPDNVCYNDDTNELIRRINTDLIYIDPPYNSRQYCDLYHLLENIARWEKPHVSGVARKMDRDSLKSDYCTNKATSVFEDLIVNANTRYILLSYNNMAQKGDDRSNAKISDDDILRILSAKGEVKVYTHGYRPFSAGKTDIDKHEERLFLCVCKPKKRKVIQSPLNYTGGKFKLINQMIPHFPDNIDTFVDLFCGGCNVGINVDAKKVILNDNNQNLIKLYNILNNLDSECVLNMIDKIISKYGLSRSSEYGYAFYGCESSSGLALFNQEPFFRLRDDFNKQREDTNYYIMLFTLIVFSFNNQIRFNSNGEFNLPVGKRDFNEKMREKLTCFIDRVRNGGYSFTCMDFNKFDTSGLTGDSLIYCDPPYLITCATYNEQGGWGERDERLLLAFLDRLDAAGLRFALSNVLTSKGRFNRLLATWAEKYRVIHLDHDYANSSYQTRDKSGSADEVLIVNYNEVVGHNLKCCTVQYPKVMRL